MAILSNAERLEQIKDKLSDFQTTIWDLTEDDYMFLYEQAERVEKAEELINKLHRGLGTSIHLDRSLWVETDRYMKSLEETK